VIGFKFKVVVISDGIKASKQAMCQQEIPHLKKKNNSSKQKIKKKIITKKSLKGK
jgi:hypothetical protein